MNPTWPRVSHCAQCGMGSFALFPVVVGNRGLRVCERCRDKLRVPARGFSR